MALSLAGGKEILAEKFPKRPSCLLAVNERSLGAERELGLFIACCVLLTSSRAALTVGKS